MTTVSEAIEQDAEASAYLLKDSTSGNSTDFVLRGGPTWIFLDVEDDPDESIRIIIDLPKNSIVRAFRDATTITIKYRTQYTPTDGTEATGDYAVFAGGASDVENAIFSVTAGSNVRLYTRTARPDQV